MSISNEGFRIQLVLFFVMLVLFSVFGIYQILGLGDLTRCRVYRDDKLIYTHTCREIDLSSFANEGVYRVEEVQTIHEIKEGD